MTPSSKLLAVKLVHTIIWAIMLLATVHASWASLTDRFDTWFLVSVALIGAEVLVLVTRRFECPLTALAKRYTDDRAPNFDIFLPRWLAERNVGVFSAILVLVLLANLLRRVL